MEHQEAPLSVITAVKSGETQQAEAIRPDPKPIRLFPHHDPYPEESRDTLLNRLDAYLDNSSDAFTEKHADWILEKARKAQDREGVIKMLTFAQKVVKNANTVADAAV